MHYNLVQQVNGQRVGSISDVLSKNIIKDIVNDGDNFTNFKEIDPESQMPAGFNQEVIIRLTDADFDITQMNESFLSMTVHATLKFSDLIYSSIANDIGPEFQKAMFLFVGLKNSSDIFQDYTIYHRGLTISNSLQNDAAIESALYHSVESKASKNNKKYVHSLYDPVHEYDTSASGVYISLYDLRNIASANREYTVDIPVNIPITDILPFQAFREYPNNLFGELKIKFRISDKAFVFVMVDPTYSTHKYFFSHGFSSSIDATEKAEILTLTNAIPKMNEYDRGFFQFGTTGRMGYLKFETPNYSIDSKPLSISMTTYTIPKCSCVIRGFKMDKKALEIERQKYSTELFTIPAQRIGISTFPQSASSTALKTSQNIALHFVTDFMVYFPKYPQQITCWENPMLQNLQLNTLNHNYPERAISTIDPVFVQMQLQAADLSTFNMEATDEFENSMTTPRANDSQRIRPHTDLTSFVALFPVERSSGVGLYFDGLDTKGQNVSVELRGNPIYQGANDTYYDPVGDGSVHPPPPVLAMVQDTFWIFSAKNGGTCIYEINKDYNSVIGEM
jgi:hypothetical protein